MCSPKNWARARTITPGPSPPKVAAAKERAEADKWSLKAVLERISAKPLHKAKS
jgi:hypothetical protein